MYSEVVVNSGLTVLLVSYFFSGSSNNDETESIDRNFVVKNVVQFNDPDQTSANVRRIIPPNLTTIRTATFQMTSQDVVAIPPPTIVVEPDNGEWVIH